MLLIFSQHKFTKAPPPPAYPEKVQKLIDALELFEKEQPGDLIELDGYKWVPAHQPTLAKYLDYSVRTLQEIIRHPPIVRDYVHINGAKRLLLRVGVPGQETRRHRANKMSYIYRKTTGRRVDKRSYGCLLGLADLWGDHAVSRFRVVLNNWSGFMSGVKLAIGILQDKGELLGGKHPKSMWFKAPYIPTILRFEQTAVEFCEMEAQAAATAHLSKHMT